MGARTTTADLNTAINTLIAYARATGEDYAEDRIESFRIEAQFLNRGDDFTADYIAAGIILDLAVAQRAVEGTEE